MFVDVDVVVAVVVFRDVDADVAIGVLLADVDEVDEAVVLDNVDEDLVIAEGVEFVEVDVVAVEVVLCMLM